MVFSETTVQHSHTYFHFSIGNGSRVFNRIHRALDTCKQWMDVVDELALEWSGRLFGIKEMLEGEILVHAGCDGISTRVSGAV